MNFYGIIIKPPVHVHVPSRPSRLFARVEKRSTTRSGTLALIARALCPSSPPPVPSARIESYGLEPSTNGAGTCIARC
jgi:hypothetical protein